MAFTVKSRRERSSSIVSPWSVGHVVRVPRGAVDRAPGAEALGQREHRPSEAAGHGPRGVLRVPGHGHVHVGDGAAEQLVAHGPAHDPSGSTPERVDQGIAHLTGRRCTRGDNPQVIS